MYNDPFNRCQIVQPKTWDSIMDAAEADIKSNPRLIFTPKHKDWRDILKWVSSQGVSRLFESLPYEVQNDIYVNDNEVFAELSEDAKKRFNEARQKYYPDGGQINPPNGETSITARNTKQYDFPPLLDTTPWYQSEYQKRHRRQDYNPLHFDLEPVYTDGDKANSNTSTEPVYDGGMLPEIPLLFDPMPWYQKAYRKAQRALKRGVDAVKKTLNAPMNAQGLLNGSPSQSMLGYNAYIPSTVGNELEFATTSAAIPFLPLKPVQIGMAGYGAYNLASENGVSKTIDHIQKGEIGDATASAFGDVLNLSLTLPFATNTVNSLANGVRRINATRAATENFTDLDVMIDRMNSEISFDGNNPFADGRMTGYRKWALDNGASPERILKVENELAKNNWQSLKKYETHNGTTGSNPLTGDIYVNRNDPNFNQLFPHEVGHKLFTKLFNGTRNSITAEEANAAFDRAIWQKLSNKTGGYYFIENDFEEILTRFTQIKNALGIKEARALTESELRQAYRMFKAGDGRIANNDMDLFFGSIKDWKAAAKLSGKALSLTGVGASIFNTSDYEEGF